MPKYVKRLPEHIYPLFDEKIQQWGIWNSRLQMWHGKDDAFGHTVYASEQEAREQFLENF